LASVETDSGKLTVSGLRNTYKPHLSKVEDGAAHLLHASGGKGDDYQCFMLNRGGFLDHLPKVLTCEWSVRVPVSVGNARSFMVTLAALSEKDGKVRELQLTQSASGFFVNSRVVPNGIVRKDGFNDFRLALDRDTGEYVLWCGEEILDNGSLAPRADRKESFVVVGDGSGSIEGEAYLKYLRLGGVAGE
jgi:hypothetical protein